MLDYAEVLIADPDTRTITITSEDGSRTAEVQATVSLGVDVGALEDTSILAEDRMRLKRATGEAADVRQGDLVRIPGEPDYVVSGAPKVQPRTDSILYALVLFDPEDA